MRIARIVRRGLRLAYGSWKTTWIRGRIAGGTGTPYGSPSSATVPEVGRSSPLTIRPIVDLPEPDSPTSPTISPCPTSKLTSSTAVTDA